MEKMSNMRVKLVFFRTLYSQSGASLTMGSIAAYLREGGYSADLCLLEKQNLHSLGKVLAKDKDEDLIIIVKPNFKDYDILFPSLQAMKRRKRVYKIFLCGPFASLNAVSIMKANEWVDGIFIEALEQTALEVVKRVSEGKSLHSCGGGVWRKGPSIVGPVAVRGYIPLDKLPFPVRDIEAVEAGSFVNIEASRGCLYNCSFCHIPLVNKASNGSSTIDTRDPSKVVDEMEYLYRNLNKTLFIFNDSVFWASNGDNERILRFCSEIRRRKMAGISMYVYLRCNPFIDDKVLDALVDVGLVRVFLGVESASKRSQRFFKKPIGADSYISIKRKFDRLGVNIHIGYIVFEPFSTLDEIRSNIEYLFDIGKMFRIGTVIEPVRVVPGSFVHKELLRNHLMDIEQEYDSITYGYRFAHEDVDTLFRHIKKVFGDSSFGNIAYRFEYYCTTIGIMRTMLSRFDPELKRKVLDESNEFANIQREMEKKLLDFFRSLIEIAESSGELEGSTEAFVMDFSKDFYELEVVYDSILDRIGRNGGSKYLSQIYSGLERINS